MKSAVPGMAVRSPSRYVHDGRLNPEADEMLDPPSALTTSSGSETAPRPSRTSTNSHAEDGHHPENPVHDRGHRVRKVSGRRGRCRVQRLLAPDRLVHGLGHRAAHPERERERVNTLQGIPGSNSDLERPGPRRWLTRDGPSRLESGRSLSLACRDPRGPVPTSPAVVRQGAHPLLAVPVVHAVRREPRAHAVKTSSQIFSVDWMSSAVIP